MHFQICGNNDGNIIHVFKNCISISVATVLEVSKMTVPVCTSHWCLVTDLEVHFSVLKKGVSQYFCVYIVYVQVIGVW